MDHYIDKLKFKQRKMKMMIKQICVFAMIFMTGFANGQSFVQISGKVIDDNDKGIDLAQVALMNASDSSYVKSEFTDEDGTFLMTHVAEGNYVLQISLLGYKDHTGPLVVQGVSTDVSLESIRLVEDVLQLEEVAVTSKTPYIERKIDRTVVNVDALIANAGSNALEVLERAPGISVDNNGSLLLKGRSGVTVFINDKPTYLSGTELESYLKSLPAGTLKKIEIMTNPPSKYEAAGNSGVINIITKKNTLLGFYGNISASVQQGEHTRSNNSLNLNYNKNKFSLFANIYGGYYKTFQDLNINRHYKNEQNERLSSFSQNSFNLREGRYINVKVGLDYYVGDQTTIGVSYKNQDSPSKPSTDNNATVTNAQNVLEQRVVADNDQDRSFKSQVYNAYINHKLDTLGSSISLDADYVRYTSGNDQNFKNFIYNNADELIFQDQINGQIPSEIEIYAAKTDYTKPIGKTAKFEAGLKSAYTKTDNEAIYSTTIDGATEPDYDLSNRFLYDEWIHAGYTNYTRSFGAIDIQVGLRAESTKITGNQLGNVQKPDSTFTRTYTNFFPTFYTSWKMDSTSNNVLTFSYGRRIDRPYFQDLNPFISPLDKFTFYSGNPDLLPTFSNNFSLAHSYKGIVNTSLNYSKTTDGINETLEIREGIYYSRPGNIATNQTYSLSVDASVAVKPWYNINAYVELGHQRFDSDLYTEQLNSRGTYYYLSATNSFQLGKGWKADLTGRYQSDIVHAQLLIKSYGLVNIGVQKNILNNNGSLKLALNDIFRTRRGDGIINNLRLTDADWNSTFDSRSARLTFSYRFGKSTSNKQKYNSSGSESEQRRVRG